MTPNVFTNKIYINLDRNLNPYIECLQAKQQGRNPRIVTCSIKNITHFGNSVKRVPRQLIRSRGPSRTETFVTVGTRDNDGTPEMIPMIVLMVAAVINYIYRAIFQTGLHGLLLLSECFLLFIRNYGGIYCWRYRQDNLTVLLGSD